MNKTKLLTIGVIVLVVINLVTLSFFIINKPHDGRERKAIPREIVIKKLHFDPDQVMQYEQLIKIHKDSIVVLDNKIKKYKNELYRQLTQEEDKKAIDQLFLEIATTQAAIERLHFNHFLTIKKLCKPDQLEDYNELTHELAKIFNPKLPPKDLNRAP
ncbi:hypothetical protein [Flavobacterium sp. SM2513]|uniref:hypothetical protein n=1 Tax=Flavobacterium sp. SM2513 TaxID=3424766 RepID=UPI003D7F8D1C